jgi:hypothetical protein
MGIRRQEGIWLEGLPRLPLLPQRETRRKIEKRKPDTPRLSEVKRREIIGGFPDAKDTVFLPQDEEEMDQHYAEISSDCPFTFCCVLSP